MDNDKMLIKVQEYIKHASISLSQAIQDKETEHAFLPSSKKNSMYLEYDIRYELRAEGGCLPPNTKSKMLQYSIY